MIITIDGPAGSGKSTAARNLARKLGIAYLDTGATYRAVTLKALREGVDLEDETALARIAGEMDLQLRSQRNGVHVLLDGCDMTEEIRTGQVTDNAHYIARSQKARDVLVGLQRQLGRKLGAFIAEGRDQGSVVFPEADLKFYLVASPEVRAQRRHAEMTAAGENVSYNEVLQAILQRDRRDRTRDVAPLIRPQGAIEVDTTTNTVEETEEQLLRLVEGSK